jgi:hypothetical protein
MFSLVSARYERASLIVTSNKPFSAWGDIFGDDATAAAMIDRLIHHAELISLKGDSYRLRGKDLGAQPAEIARPIPAAAAPRAADEPPAPRLWTDTPRSAKPARHRRSTAVPTRSSRPQTATQRPAAGPPRLAYGSAPRAGSPISSGPFFGSC